MTSSAAIAQEMAVEQVSPIDHQQHQGPCCPQEGHHPPNTLCLSPMLNSPSCGTNSNNRMNTGTQDVILDWAKSMNTSSSNLTVISSPDLFTAAAAAAAMASSLSSNSSKNYKNKLSSQNNKKRKNHPISTAGSPRTTMIAPPMVLNLDQEFQQQQQQAQELLSPGTGVGAGDQDLGTTAFFPAVHAPGASLLASSANPNPAKKVKRWGGLIQRTHSPLRNKSTTMQQPSAGGGAAAPIRLQLVTPTVEGIQHVARHLLEVFSSSSSAFAAIPQLNTNGTSGNCNEAKEHPLVVMPTECTYEAIALIDWNKTEALSPSLETLREDRLRHLQWAASAAPISTTSGSSLHLILPHDNIKMIDRLFSFPKKAYAIKQNLQEGCSTMNESRVVFQRLADHFWPGPVLIYLTVPPATVVSPTGGGQQLAEPRQQLPCQKVPQALLHRGPEQDDKSDNNSIDERRYVGFRCPSHPLSVKVLRQVNRPAFCRRESGSTSDGSSTSLSLNNANNNASTNRKVLVTSSIAALSQKNKTTNDTPCRLLLHGKEVALQLASQLRNKQVEQQNLSTTSAAATLPSVQILQGEEKREMFTVPTCQFQDEWLECWIVQESRTVVIRGKSRRPLPSLTALFKLSSSTDPSSSGAGGGMTSPPPSPAPFCSGHSNNRVVRSVLGQWKIVDQRNLTH